MNDKERNHISIVFFQFFKSIYKEFLFIILAYTFLNDKIGSKLAVLMIIIGIAADILICFLKWYQTIYYFKDSSIFYQRGVLNITRSEIPFEKVNTVDISQSIVYKIFNLSKIKIDTGNVKNDKSEISLLVKNKRALEIKDTLLKREVNEEKTEKEYESYSLSIKQLLIYALTSNVLLKGMGIIYVIYNFLDDYILKLFKINIEDSAQRFIKTKLFNNILFGVITTTVMIITLSIIFSLISTLIKYYNFKVYNDDDKLNISYGLINQKNYCFDKKKIKGIHIKQSLLMQFFNISTIEIESIGYGDEKGEKAILYPLCNKKFENKIIEELLPDFIYDGTVDKAPKKSYPRFIFKKFIFIIVLSIILIHYFKYGYLSLILLFIAFVLGHMQYKNSSMGLSDKLVYMSYKGFNRTQSIIKTSSIQAITMSYSYFQKRKGLCNYTINIFSNSFGNSISVKNLLISKKITIGSDT